MNIAWLWVVLDSDKSRVSGANKYLLASRAGCILLFHAGQFYEIYSQTAQSEWIWAYHYLAYVVLQSKLVMLNATYFRSTSMLISTIQPVTLNALGGVPKIIFKACTGRPIFSEHPDHVLWKSPKCGPETPPKSKMLERADSHHRAPTQRQLCAALCCATSDKRILNFTWTLHGRSWQRVLLDSDKSTDECADWTHRCAIRKNRQSPPASRQIAAYCAALISFIWVMPVRRKVHGCEYTTSCSKVNPP